MNKAVSILLLVYLTGYLDPSLFGRYSFVVAYTTFFGIFTDLGLTTLTTRDISSGAVNPSVAFGHAIIIRLISTLLTAAVLLASLALLGYPAEVTSLAAAFSLSLFVSFRGIFFRTVFDIPFQVNLKMSCPAVINFLNELLTLGVVVWLISRGTGLVWLVLAISLANIPGFAAAGWYSIRLIRPRIKFDPSAWAAMLRESLPLGAAVFFEGVFVIIPVFLLSLLSSEEAIGFYGLSFRLVSSLWIIPVAVMTTLLPKMSRDAVSATGSVRHGFSRGLKLVLLMGLPIALVTGFYSRPIISLVAGPAYISAAPALSVMVWGTVIYFINTVFFYTFTAAGRQKINTLVGSILCVVSLLACAVLVPAHHQMGAAAGFVGALVAGLLANLYLAHRALGVNVLPVLSRFLASTVLTLFVVFSVPLHHALSLTLGIAVYLATLLYFRTINYREWEEWLGMEEVKTGERPG